MPEQDDITRDPTGRLTVNRAGTYRISYPLVNADPAAKRAGAQLDLVQQELSTRYEARIAELEAALHALVDDAPVCYGEEPDYVASCAYCEEESTPGVPVAHDADCPISKGRELLKTVKPYRRSKPTPSEPSATASATAGQPARPSGTD